MRACIPLLLRRPIPRDKTALSHHTMRAAVVAICHGGGPLPLLHDPGHQHIVDSLQTRVPAALRLHSATPPRAILLLTAHWETEPVTISSARKHDLYYDYYGFPAEAYHLRYDAPGDPAIA